MVQYQTSLFVTVSFSFAHLAITLSSVAMANTKETVNAQNTLSRLLVLFCLFSSDIFPTTFFITRKFFYNQICLDKCTTKTPAISKNGYTDLHLGCFFSVGYFSTDTINLSPVFFSPGFIPFDTIF